MSRAKRTWIKGFFRSGHPNAKRILVFANSEWDADVAIIERGKPTSRRYIEWDSRGKVFSSYDPTGLDKPIGEECY